MAFLAGKYQPGEQVIDGTVQTFRGKQLATGKPVFLHRIPPGSPQEQEPLFKILLVFLYSSSPAKDQIIDFGREGEICYVVTQNLPQCLLLREWLQFELERCGEGDGDAETVLGQGRGQAPYEVVSQVVSEKRQRSQAAEKVQEALAIRVPARTAEENRGEFTRLFYSDARVSVPQAAPVKAVTLVPPEMKLGEGAPLAPATVPELEAAERQRVDSHAPGEFTRLFETPGETGGEEHAAASSEAEATAHTEDIPQTSKQREEEPDAAQPSASNASGGTAPGEFTRFFESSGMHVQRYRASDLPAAVQRPAHAMTPLPPPAKGISPQGEFTRFFSNSPADVMGTASPRDESAPAPTPSPVRNVTDQPANQPGEFTKMFSAAKAEPEARSQEGKGAQSAERSGGADNSSGIGPEARSPLFESAQIPAGPSLRAEKLTPAPGPSEFTRVVKGVKDKAAIADGAEEQASARASAAQPEDKPLFAGTQQKKSGRTLVLILLALLAAAVVLVVFLQLKS